MKETIDMKKKLTITSYQPLLVLTLVLAMIVAVFACKEDTVFASIEVTSDIPGEMEVYSSDTLYFLIESESYIRDISFFEDTTRYAFFDTEVFGNETKSFDFSLVYTPAKKGKKLLKLEITTMEDYIVHSKSIRVVE